MENMEKIKAAKAYIDKLANGIDPISGREMPGDALLNDVHLTRCFFFVSETLGAVIKNGWVSKAIKNVPFYITSEQKREVSIEDKCYFSYFITRINEVAEGNGCMKLSRVRVYYWLVLKGFMREYYENERLRREGHSRRGESRNEN